MNITVIGLGYVGLVTAAVLAEWGNRVTGVDSNPGRLAQLRNGRAPFHEPGLDDLVSGHAGTERLTFDSDVSRAVGGADVVIAAVGTHDGNGGWQTETMRTCLMQVVPGMRDDAVLVIRSTLPPDFISELPAIVVNLRAEVGRAPLPVVLNPEFTREGSAVSDFMAPERIVVGVAYDPDGAGTRAVERVYGHLNVPILVMAAVDAALAKLGANLFLATKVSFANELASLCDRFGAGVDAVLRAMSYDPRIGDKFLRPGVGFGGSCLPNQVRMTVRSIEELGGRTPLLAAVNDINDGQRTEFVSRVESLVGGSVAGRRIALLGLTFKPNTDDLRDAPSLTIARLLLDRGARVVATDPMSSARVLAAQLTPGLVVTDDPMEALAGADALCLLTEWPAYGRMDWHAIRSVMAVPLAVDGRNFLPSEDLVRAGFVYSGFGRGSTGRTPEDAQIAADQLENFLGATAGAVGGRS